MRQEWSPEDVIACWTLVDGDWDLVANKAGTTRLGFCLMLKFFELEGRFPDLLEEIPQAAVEYVAGLVKVPAAEFAKYDLASRSAKNHRKQIREALKFRPATQADEDQLIMWLADEVCPVELVENRQRDALLVECRARKIEPPGRIDRILAAAQSRAEKAFCTRTIERLGQVCTARLLALVTEGNEDGTALLASLKRDPGAVGLDSLLTEITKLNDVRKLGLPEGLFAHCSERLLAAWRARAIKMYPSDFRDTAEDVRITLLAALCSSRQAEITDALADLLIALVQKINARAERRVEKQLTAELKKVRGKEGIFFKLADAAVGKPDEIVRTALYPVVGEKTLRDLVAEAKANGRGAAELLTIAEDLRHHDIQLELLTGPLQGVYDPSGHGAALFAFFAGMAESEREYIREKSLEGQASARERGRHGGRPKVVDDDMAAYARSLRANGVPVPEIARKLVITSGKNQGKRPSVATVYRILAEDDSPIPQPEHHR
ncbi:DUF4158 domain-containing protein [Streptomyces sp. AM6-12]|uniref:DUF4158 domain-containing protein n=1 Tax=Streptomyces sp. AM6-12 TaxID=3345149 RepID=UPI0037B2936B